MRVPRKKKKVIPTGVYCYNFISYNEETGSVKIKCCSYFTISYDTPYMSAFGYCKLLKTEIEDQVKNCGIKI